MHPRRHGSVRLEQGDDRAWCYRDYDDSGRVVFRLDQRDGSPVPPDSTDYSISNLPSSSVAFATTYDYTPLPGDDCRSNDCDKVRVETKYVVDRGVPILIGKTWKTYQRGTSDGYPTIIVTTERAASQAAVLGDVGNAVSVEARFDDESEAVPYVLRGELASRIDEDGVTMRYERSDAQGVLRTVERRFFNGNEAKTRRVTEQDWNYGNLLYEAEAISADGTEFGWARHVYDGKNRLIFTRYDDGSWETNAYSCCRLLWTIDRTGAKRLRSARTGTDQLYYADEEVFVAELPDDGFLRPDDWDSGNLKNAFRITQHFMDGLGRETNTHVRSHYTAGVAENPLFTWTKGAHAVEATSYPQGVSDLRVSVSAAGRVTTERRTSTSSGETVESSECDPGNTNPVSVVVRSEFREGGWSERRSTPLGWRESREWDEFAADGSRCHFTVSDSSDSGPVTNAIVRFDFLGRIVRTITPQSDVAISYHGSTGRKSGSADSVSGVVETYLYDSLGDLSGTVSNGRERLGSTDYAEIGGEWWRVESDILSSASVTATCAIVRTRLTGLSDDLRSEIVSTEDGRVVSVARTSFDPAAKTLTTTTESEVDGETVVRSMFGIETERQSATGLYRYYHDPWCRTFSIHRGNSDGSSVVRYKAYDFDIHGNVTGAYDMRGDYPEDAYTSHFGYDCRGNRIVATNAVGDIVTSTYDANGNPLENTGDTYPVRTGYDAQARRIALETTRDGALFDRTGWAYDPMTGFCTGKTYADGSSIAYTATPDGLPLRTTYPGGHWVENAYDASRDLLVVDSGDPTCRSWFSNDVFGRLTAASNAVAKYEFALSGRGTATNETSVFGGRSFVISRDLDAYGRVVALRASGHPGLAFAYSPSGRIATASNAEVSVSYVYDALDADMGWTLTLTNGVSFLRRLTRDRRHDDKVTSVVNVCGGDTNRYDYTYDALHRPVTRNADTFAYNRRGEVANEVVAGVVRTHAYDFIGNEQPANCLNQYLGLAYSPNGELVSDGTFTYAYDALSRLTAAYSNGTLVVSNRYDHLGRRVVKIAADGTHTFLYDGWRPLVETVVRPDSTTDRIDYVWGKDISGTLDGAAGIGGLLYLKLNGAIYVPFYDAYGNVMGYRDAEGNTVAEYVYDAFGQTVAQNGTMADVFTMRYSTKYYDAEMGLYYYGKRHYSPVWRRWLTRDPIGEEGGVNLYGFCGNNAVARWDADGRAYFAVRPLHNCPFMIQGSIGSYLDVKNIEFLHEQLFFEDGGIFPTIGWGDDQEGSGKGMYMLYEDPSQYQKRDGGYDDCVMREAVRQVQPSHYQMTIIGRATKCNCQDYAAALRAKYKVLENDHDVWCKCCKEKR